MGCRWALCSLVLREDIFSHAPRHKAVNLFQSWPLENCAFSRPSPVSSYVMLKILQHTLLPVHLKHFRFSLK